MRLRRLRSGTVAAVRLRPPRGGYPSSGVPIRDEDLPRPAPGPGPGSYARECGKPGCLIETPGHRHIGWGPTRPHPAANAWPDDAVTVSYAELRRLVALHLDLARQGMPADRPWEWISQRAGAVRDGEAPLLLSEVMEP